MLWVSHYNRTVVMVLVVKQLLCLVDDGCLWLDEPIPNTDRLIHRITRFLYTSENLAIIFGEKGGEQALAESMKEKFKLVKKLHNYSISCICYHAVKVATKILAGKVIRKSRTNEVLVPVVALEAQCAEGVQFNWLDCLRREFLANYHEAQELSRMFHYAWLLLSIVLVACEVPEDSQLASIMSNLPNVANYTSLWVTKDAP